MAPRKNKLQATPIQIIDMALAEAFNAAAADQAAPGQLEMLRAHKWTLFDAVSKSVSSVNFDEMKAKGAWSKVVNAPWFQLENLDKNGEVVPRRPRARKPPGVRVLNLGSNSKASKGDTRGLTTRELRQLDTLLCFRQQDPSDRPVSLVSQALTLCPLPFRRSGGKVEMEARLPGGKIEVVLTCVGSEKDGSTVAYGDDALLLDLLSHEARFTKNPEISFDRAYELLEFLGIEGRGGNNYKQMRDRIQRLGDLHIRIKRVGVGWINVRVVDVGSDDIPTSNDMAKEKNGERRVVPYILRLSPEYFLDLMHYYLAIPTSVIQAFRGSPTEYSLAKWLAYRLDALERPTEIPLEDLHRERGSQDSNIRRFKAKLEMTIAKLQEAWPEVGTALKVTKTGLQMQKPTAPLAAGRPQPEIFG